MQFVVFIALMFAISLFHRREHVLYIAELRELQKKLALQKREEHRLRDLLKGGDWRVVKLEGSKLHLRRAFEIPDKEAQLRYFVPVGLLILTILLLGSFTMAAIYACLLCLKWFGSVTILDLDPLAPWYEVTLFGKKLFGESLAEKPVVKT